VARLSISSDLSLYLPADTVTQTIVVYGGRGTGKTNFGRVLAEELSECKRRFAVIDPMGVWYGLQYAADGKSPGIEVLVLGGKHGDIPIEPTGGAVVADLVADEEVDVIVDISRRTDGKMWSKGEKIRFVTDYVTRLYERQGERRRPLMQIIDEAARYIPQMARAGDIEIAKCMGAIEQMVEEGRNVGLGVTLITQRSARMNKSVSELAECMIAFRTIGPNSLSAIIDWLGDHVPKQRWQAIEEQLRKLPVGQALVVSPGWLDVERVVKTRLADTFDSSATPTGGERRVSGKAKKPDLDKYKERMLATIEKAKADDPRELRKRIAELEKAAKARQPAPVATTEPKTVVKEVPVLTAKELAAIERSIKESVALNSMLARLMEQWSSALKRHGPSGNLWGQVQPAITTPAHRNGVKPHAPHPSAPVPKTMPNVDVDGDWRPGKCELKILNVLGMRHPKQTLIGPLAVMCGYRMSGGFKNSLTKLRTRGLIDGDNTGPIHITSDGMDIAPAEPLPTGRALLDMWNSKIGKCERKVIEHLMSIYPNVTDTESIADATGYRVSGGFKNSITKLRTLELAEGYKDQIRATDTLGGG
jgi:uncharacterized protein